MGDHDQENSRLNADVMAIKDDMTSMRESIGQIASALTKLAILEERQATQTTLVQKTLDRLEKIEEKAHTTELRFAVGAISIERITALDVSVKGIITTLTGLENARKNAVNSARLFWSIFGGTITAVAAAVLIKVL